MPERVRPTSRTSRTRVPIGSHAATSWPVLGIMTAMLLIDRLGTDLERTGRPFLLVSSALVGSLTIAGLLRLARVTSARRGATAAPPRSSAMILWALIAACSAALTGRIHDREVGLPVDESLAHIFQRTGWGFTVLLLLIISANAVTAHRTELQTLAVRSTNLLRTRAEVDLLLSTATASRLATITEEVRAELRKLEGADLATAVALLRSVGLRIIRSQSHELVRTRTPFLPVEHDDLPAPPRLGDLAADVTAERPMRPALPAAMVALWGTAFTLEDSGLMGALTVGAVLGLLALLIWAAIGSLVHRSLEGRRIRTRVVIVMVGMLIAAICWVAAAELVEGVLGLTLPTAETSIQRGAQALTLTLFPIVQVLTRALKRRGELSVASMEDYAESLEAEVARANTELWVQRRTLADALHGPVQSAISAATLRLSDAARDGIRPEGVISRVRTDIERALAGLETGIAQGHPEDADDLDRAIARICGLWEGLVDISVDLTDADGELLRSDRTTRMALIDTLIEACSNAVRHGNAQRIRVRVSREDRGTLLEVVDDGRMDGTGVPGRGSTLLDEITLGWRREHKPYGTRLIATFARPSPASSMSSSGPERSLD